MGKQLIAVILRQICDRYPADAAFLGRAVREAAHARERLDELERLLVRIAARSNMRSPYAYFMEAWTKKGRSCDGSGPMVADLTGHQCSVRGSNIVLEHIPIGRNRSGIPKGLKM